MKKRNGGAIRSGIGVSPVQFKGVSPENIKTKNNYGRDAR